ncbi:head-tail adaptor protein [Cellulomonas sp. NPDC058312]|uniref:head-tail adaptor protein n=1 Tax=Cellulomonas sp. NPDC058312 TaxID=3346441 RepID=UPI0036EB3E9B
MIPLPFTAGLRAFIGSAEDDLGNPTEGWGTAVETSAVWWTPSSVATSEQKMAGHDRVVVDLVMVVDSATAVGPRDRVVIDGRDFEVIGYPEDFDHGPWWQPGRKPVNLRRIEVG